MASIPATFNTPVGKMKYRSLSVNSFLSRLLPSNREEKGGTLRREEQPIRYIDNESNKIKPAPVVTEPPQNTASRFFGLGSRSLDNRSPLPSPNSPPGHNRSNTEQLFQAKKIQRLNRRSLKESGDYLGVQGANPRTGTWDPSASSSTPSQLSEETKRKLDEEARKVEEQKRLYEEARAQLHHERHQRWVAQERKRAQKSEQKRQEMKLREKRHGRWRLGDHGWSSVAEPELSPIIQSTVGSPYKERPDIGDDYLFPMPSAADPHPYVNGSQIEPQDYFGHRQVSSPLTADQIQSATSIPRKAVGTAPIVPPVDLGHKLSSVGTIFRTISKDEALCAVTSLPGPSDHRRRISSLGTINLGREAQKVPPGSWSDDRKASPHGDTGSHTAETAKVYVTRPSTPVRVASAKFNPFLGPSLKEKSAIATSYRSTWTMNTAPKLQRLAQNRSSSMGVIGNQIVSIQDLPPVAIKDPISARIMSNSPPPALTSIPCPQRVQSYQEDHLREVAPQTQLRSEPKMSTQSNREQALLNETGRMVQLNPIQRDQALTVTLRRLSIIPTTTTTGQDLPQLLFGQDGTSESASQAKKPLLQKNLNTIPVRTSSFSRPSSQKKTKLSSMRNRDSQVLLTLQRQENATSSEHLLHPIKERSAKLCQVNALEKGATSKSTPTSISTSPHRSEKGKAVAQNAAITALQNSKLFRAAFRKSKGGKEGRVSKVNEAPGRDGTAGPSRIMHEVVNGEHVVYEKDNGLEEKTARIKHGRDNLGAVHAPPYQTNPDSIIVGLKDGGVSLSSIHAEKTTGKRVRVPLSMSQVAVRIMGTIWWFVEPVFDPASALRHRWEENRLTWQDITAFVVAGIFTGCLCLVLIVCGKTIGIALRVMRLVSPF